MTDVNLRKQKYLNAFLNFLLKILAIICVFGTIYSFVGIAAVQGHSMEPTYTNGKILFYHRCSDPQRGSIVIFRGSGKDFDENMYVIKRVVAISGDTIECKNNTVYVDDKEVEEPYIKGMTSNFSKITVPKGCIFVMGDNRENSLDSREVGCIPLKEVLGKVG